MLITGPDERDTRGSGAAPISDGEGEAQPAPDAYVVTRTRCGRSTFEKPDYMAGFSTSPEATCWRPGVVWRAVRSVPIGQPARMTCECRGAVAMLPGAGRVVRLGLVGALLAAMLVISAAPAAARAGSGGSPWVDLGPGQTYGVNDQGQIVGSAPSSTGSIAVMWQNGTRIRLGSLGDTLTRCAATALNREGQVVGNCWNTRESVYHAFLWSRGQMRDLGTLGGPVTEAWAINNRGDIAGYGGSSAGGNLSAVLWSGGRIHDLGTLGAGWPNSLGWDLNALDQVVGWNQTASSYLRAFVVTNGSMGELPGPGSSSEAFAINDNGQIAGVQFIDSLARPALWSGGALTVLPTLAGQGAALAINKTGELAGWVASAAGKQHAATWSLGRLTDHGTFAGAPTLLRAINDFGEAVGRSRIGGHNEAIALTAPQRSRRPAR